MQRRLASILTTALLAFASLHCFVDVPDADEASFACESDDDCVDGFTCLPTDSRPGSPSRCVDREAQAACQNDSCGDQVCFPDPGKAEGFRCESCSPDLSCGEGRDCVRVNENGQTACAPHCSQIIGGSCQLPQGGAGVCVGLPDVDNQPAQVCVQCPTCSGSTCRPRGMLHDLTGATYCDKTGEDCLALIEDDVDGDTAPRCADWECAAKPVCMGGGQTGSCTIDAQCPGSPNAACVKTSSGNGVCVSVCNPTTPSTCPDGANDACVNLNKLVGGTAFGCVLCAGGCTAGTTECKLPMSAGPGPFDHDGAPVQCL